MRRGLRLASALCRDVAKGDELAIEVAQTAARVVITEAILREPPVDHRAILRACFPIPLHALAEVVDLLLVAGSSPCLERGRFLRLEWQLDAALRQRLVERREKRTRATDTQIRRRLVDELAHFDGRKRRIECLEKHDAKLVHTLTAEQRRENRQVTLACGQRSRLLARHLLACEVGETLRELGIGRLKPCNTLIIRHLVSPLGRHALASPRIHPLDT